MPGTELNEKLALAKTKVEKLSLVKNLNLWGCELNDVSLIRQMPHLEVLALSVNHVSTLRDVAACTSLRELYLRKNEIASLGEVHNLSRLPNLSVLWLCDNPCATHPNYRLYTIRCCPALKQFDNVEVTAQERADALALPKALVAEISQPPSSSARRPSGGAPSPSTDLRQRDEGRPTPASHPAPQIANHNQQQQQRPVSEGRRTSQQSQLDGPHQAKPTSAPSAAAQPPRTTTAVANPPASSSSNGGAAPAGPSAVPAAVPTAQTSHTAHTTTGHHSARQTQKHVLSAMLTLLPELSADSLNYLRREVDEQYKRVTSHGQNPPLL